MEPLSYIQPTTSDSLFDKLKVRKKAVPHQDKSQWLFLWYTGLSALVVGIFVGLDLDLSGSQQQNSIESESNKTIEQFVILKFFSFVYIIGKILSLIFQPGSPLGSQYPLLPEAWTSRVLWGPSNRSNPHGYHGHLIPGQITMTPNLIRFKFEFPVTGNHTSEVPGMEMVELWQSRQDFSGNLVNFDTRGVMKCGKPFSQSGPSVVRDRHGNTYHDTTLSYSTRAKSFEFQE